MKQAGVWIEVPNSTSELNALIQHYGTDYAGFNTVIPGAYSMAPRGSANDGYPILLSSNSSIDPGSATTIAHSLGLKIYWMIDAGMGGPGNGVYPWDDAEVSDVVKDLNLNWNNGNPSPKGAALRLRNGMVAIGEKYGFDGWYKDWETELKNYMPIFSKKQDMANALFYFSRELEDNKMVLAGVSSYPYSFVDTYDASLIAGATYHPQYLNIQDYTSDYSTFTAAFNDLNGPVSIWSAGLENLSNDSDASQQLADILSLDVDSMLVWPANQQPITKTPTNFQSSYNNVFYGNNWYEIAKYFLTH